MELKKSFKGYLKFDDSPFIQERTACGINALIEVLELPVSKIGEVITTTVIGCKLREITGERLEFQTVDGQSIQLQFVIRRICPDEETVDRVMELCEEKFIHYIKTRNLN
jgi:hypothetical protein